MQRLVTPIGWREQARSILEGKHPRWGRPFEIFIYVLIVISMISVTIESIPQLPDNLRFSLSVAEVAIVAVFTLEYLLRNITAVRPLSYALSFWGFVDLIAIAPFYLSLGVDLRAARALRLLRLFQMLKMFRRSGDRLVAAFKRVSGELLVFAGFALIVFYLSGVGIYLCENAAQPEAFASIPHGLWWALTTLTTVGYGDVYPITVGGRIFTMFVLILGLGIIAVPTGLIASALTEVRKEEGDRQQAKAMSARTNATMGVKESSDSTD